jgi:imidazoleglycerol-phosphate dehydratase
VSTPGNKSRQFAITRGTAETSIELSVNLDGSGTVHAKTGVLFLDHMLHAFGRHGWLDLSITATGDAAMDPHHTVEDTGIALGMAIKQALGDRAGIDRYGYAYAPLDEALARVVIDVSGRPYFEFHGEMPEQVIGTDFSSTLVEEFWRSLATNGGLSMHVDLIRSRNAHHAAEAIFKAAAVAFRSAIRSSGTVTSVPSTKGLLA